jgi:hypothetical protein
MVYNIDYILQDNNSFFSKKGESSSISEVTESSDLIIYDFGSIKGFLFNNNFIMYKIINKENTKEICELYDGPIPLKAISIEKYKCYFNNGYKTPHFTVLFEEERGHQPLKKKELVVNQQKHLPHSRPLINQPRPYQQQRQLPDYQKQQQPPQQQGALKKQPIPQREEQREEQKRPSRQPLLHQQQNKKNISQQQGVEINGKYTRTQQEVSYSQQLLAVPNAGQQKQQWMSLEEVMKGLSTPSPRVGQVPHSRPVVKGQNSVALSVSHSLPVRPPQRQPVIQHQETTC